MGGIHVVGDRVGALEREIDQLCSRVGLPAGEQFKWSPGGREPFMRERLVGEQRSAFYRDLLQIAAAYEVKVCVVVVDDHYRPAIANSRNPEYDATALFLERTSYALTTEHRDGVVVIAMPSGGAAEGQRFVAECLGLIDAGTPYQSFENLPLGVLAANSRQMRLLQLADVVTSCTVARVSGEPIYSLPVFELIRPLLRRNEDRIGGIGLKIHPEYVYQNLYHWLLHDRVCLRDGALESLPDPNRPFAEHPNEALVTGEIARQARAQPGTSENR